MCDGPCMQDPRGAGEGSTDMAAAQLRRAEGLAVASQAPTQQRDGPLPTRVGHAWGEAVCTCCKTCCSSGEARFLGRFSDPILGPHLRLAFQHSYWKLTSFSRAR